jgi:regulation of enolase protein 1 (concanavalin A-like superfamily)
LSSAKALKAHAFLMDTNTGVVQSNSSLSIYYVFNVQRKTRSSVAKFPSAKAATLWPMPGSPSRLGFEV